MTEAKQQSSITEKEAEETKKYDSDTDGDLFLYQFNLALEGDKEVVPKINRVFKGKIMAYIRTIPSLLRVL